MSEVVEVKYITVSGAPDGVTRVARELGISKDVSKVKAEPAAPVQEPPAPPEETKSAKEEKPAKGRGRKAAAPKAEAKTKAKAEPAKKKATKKAAPPPPPEPEEEEELEEEEVEEEEESDDEGDFEEADEEDDDEEGEEEEESDEDDEGGSVGEHGIDPMADELQDAKRLRDVIKFFDSQGVSDLDDMISVAGSIQKDVQILRRVSNIPERVTAAYNMWKNSEG